MSQTGTLTRPQGGRALTSRNEIIARRAEAGEDLTTIARDYDMSRERVRQIVTATSDKSNDEVRTARAAYRRQTRETREEQKAIRIREVATANPEATLSALVDLTGYSLTVVKDALEWTERERRADQQVYPSVSDEDIFAVIRKVAALPNGQPLTGTFYDQNRDGGVSHARLLQRFGTWTAACAAAGVVPRSPNPGRVYTRNWSESDMIGWVWSYLSTTDSPSYARFDAWLRNQATAPSAQTVRNTLGSWVEMKRLAIDTHATTD